jgi:hypothetical protein
MEKNTKILLNKERSVDDVNVTTQFNINVDNTNKPLPVNDIDTNVNSYQVFLDERQESSIYRFYGVLNGVVSNPLYNDNIKILEDSTGVVSSKKIQSSAVFEEDGWIGFYNDEPNEDKETYGDNESSLCEFMPFDPDYSRLNIIDSDGSPNYLMKITYPYSQEDITLVQNTNGISLKDGIPIIEKGILELNGNEYIFFKTPINHGLGVRDRINLYNFIDINNDLALNQRSYAVFQLGDNKGKNKNRVFVLDIRPTDIDFQTGTSTIKRVKGDNYESEYYVRTLSALTTTYDDYDIYPAAFGINYFEDKIASFNFIKDVDVSGIVDNRGRPLSELFLTLVKNDNDSKPDSLHNRYWQSVQSGLPTDIKNRFWTRIVAGYETERNLSVNYNIRGYGDEDYATNSYFEDIDESHNTFQCDIVEYNEHDLYEISLEEIYHRINTVYRENLSTILGGGDPPMVVEDKREGYLYKPHSKIQIRDYSSFVNPVVDLQSVFDQYNITDTNQQIKLKEDYKVPFYATEISPNVYRWRELLEVGDIDPMGSGVDYPFESGAHYMYLNNRFYFMRQDPPCDYFFTSEEIDIPQDKNRFDTISQMPTFYNYTILNLTSFNGGQSASITDPVTGVSSLLDYNNYANPIKLEVKFLNFFGKYKLGVRDVPGACVEYNVLNVTDIDENC